MKGSEDFFLKPLDEGLGFYSEPPLSSYYSSKEEDFLSSSEVQSLFLGLEEKSPEFYEKLTQRLEEPIISSFEKPIKKQDSLNRNLKKNENVKINKEKNKIQIFNDQESPLNILGLPELEVMKVDFAFTAGLYMIGWSSAGALFSLQVLPSVLTLLLGFGLFHQFYVFMCRSIIGSTLGEERYHLGWRGASILKFALRSLILSLTGFVFIPLFSALFKKNLMSDYCGNLYLDYSI